MNYTKLFSLITTLIGTLMIISYFGFATRKGWKIGKMFMKGSTFTIISGLLMISTIYFSFKYFIWWEGGLIIIGSWILAATLTYFLKSSSQPVSLLLTLAGVTLYFLGFAEKAKPTVSIQRQIVVNDSGVAVSSAYDTSADVDSHVKRQSPMDTIFRLVEMSLKTDKSFRGTITLIIKNISQKNITNILLREGPSYCATLSQESKSKETNYSVDMKPGDTNIFSIKTSSNDLVLQSLTDPIGINKVRFSDGQVAIDYCNEIKKNE